MGSAGFAVVQRIFHFIRNMQNSKLQFSQSDLLKLLSYLEGELQARDVVIAALKVKTALS